MCQLQQSTLTEYKEQFPQETLRDISLKTNIQATRIFRLFNGSPMKLVEFQKFKEHLAKDTNSLLTQLANECESKLSKSRLNRLKSEMIHALKLNDMKYHSHQLTAATVQITSQVS